MDKRDLPNLLTERVLERIFSFAYHRTRDSYEAEELCSDILYAIVKTSRSAGEIAEPSAFIWKTARNVYADHARRRRTDADRSYTGDHEALLLSVADEEDGAESDEERLSFLCRRIAFLSCIYRETMIAFYIDGLSVKEIAHRQGVSENTVKQRLFSAREKLKKEVNDMEKATVRPTMFEKRIVQFVGSGHPVGNDPACVCVRSLSHHILWLCHKGAKTAVEIAEALAVPTLYVEEELNILSHGQNGEYGLLRQNGGKYELNIVLLDRAEYESLASAYTARIPVLSERIAAFFEGQKQAILAAAGLNRAKDENLRRFALMPDLVYRLIGAVEKELSVRLREYEAPKRPYTSAGIEAIPDFYAMGCDGIEAEEIVGYRRVRFRNMYTRRIKAHFRCGHNVATDPALLYAVRGIEGIDTGALTEREKENAARAVESGYLYRDGDRLYTKILAFTPEQYKAYSGIVNAVCFDDVAKDIATALADALLRILPKRLLSEWKIAATLAASACTDALETSLVVGGILTPPENGVGAEGCCMIVTE